MLSIMDVFIHLESKSGIMLQVWSIPNLSLGLFQGLIFHEGVPLAIVLYMILKYFDIIVTICLRKLVIFYYTFRRNFSFTEWAKK